jgi:uncharacterized small protein (DUF1192 family)
MDPDIGRDFCHQHIKDAQESGIPRARKWVVRESFSRDQVEQATAELRAEVERLRAECDESRVERDALVDATGSGLVLEAIQIIRSDKAEVERLRAELERRTTLDPAKEMLGWTPKLPSPPPLWGKGCPVCGLGAGGTATGYVCQRGDCPTRVTCGVPK